ncbi:TPA: ead/Ea22-like family protein [Escherichia coli]|nr:ead/Ea22-like family protein [Escherichia coli]
MSKIDYQKLREIAEKTKIAGEAPVMPFDQRINALNDFMKHFSPDIALALLDERERNQQYIKSRDQENEDIALTVGKLRVELEAAEKRIAELEAEPVSQTYNLPELIEGMEVSIDVSTCDADLGNRYFGTVTEALELDTAKNGYILLVQDAEPNFDVNGNSPVTPDAWISCSERMPEIRQTVIGWNGYAVRQCVYTRNEYAKTQKGREPRFETLTGIWHGVTHWMPLPEPPQEVNRG